MRSVITATAKATFTAARVTMSNLKYPIWIRDRRTGKVERIPYEHMLHNNGRYLFNPHAPWHGWDGQGVNFFLRYHEYFELDRTADYYVFLGKLNKLARLDRVINYTLYSGWLLNGLLAIFNFSTGHWILGTIPLLAMAVIYLIGRLRGTR